MSNSDDNDFVQRIKKLLKTGFLVNDLTPCISQIQPVPNEPALADLRGEISNLEKPLSAFAWQKLAVATSSFLENELAEREGLTSNSVFETLEEWNTYLKQENVDFEGLSPERPKAPFHGLRP